jgi:hypothetical protein
MSRKRVMRFCGSDMHKNKDPKREANLKDSNLL